MTLVIILAVLIIGHLGSITLNWRMRYFALSHDSIEVDKGGGYQRVRVYRGTIRWWTTARQMWLRRNHYLKPNLQKVEAVQKLLRDFIWGGLIGLFDWVVLFFGLPEKGDKRLP